LLVEFEEFGDAQAFAIVIPVSLILGKPYYYLFMETKMTQMIPLGRSKEDIKAREHFYTNKAIDPTLSDGL